LPALLNAARNDPERDVRRRAVNAIAVLAGSMADLKPPRPLTSEELADALVELANDENELIRSETAFALGVVAATPGADSRLLPTLEALADDPYTDARFNAAVGLARVGASGAAGAVAEMLDPESIASSLSGEKALTEQVTDAQLAAQKAFKRNTIITSALSAVDRLLSNKQTPPEQLVVLEQALASFIAAAPDMEGPAPVPDELIDAAQRTLKRVKARIAARRQRQQGRDASATLP
jgi:HEAT repeat protein